MGRDKARRRRRQDVRPANTAPLDIDIGGAIGLLTVTLAAPADRQGDASEEYFVSEGYEHDPDAAAGLFYGMAWLTAAAVGLLAEERGVPCEAVVQTLALLGAQATPAAGG